MDYRKALFTFVTDITAAHNSGNFVLEWVFPSNFNDITTHDSSSLLEYKLYRHVEITYPAISANGGPLVDPSNYTTPFYSTTNRIDPTFKLIATLPAATTTYTDYLTDLQVHNDEGILNVNGVWVDQIGSNIIDDIFHTKRRIYYKLVGVSKNISFNSTPFIYICHTNGIECRSAITQVKWNTLYYEGNTVWFNNTITNCNRTAVDLVLDIPTSRYLNVWVSGIGNTVYCLDGRNGKKIAQFILPFGNILGLRVDTQTGDGIVVGNNNLIYRCNLQVGIATSVSDIHTPYSPNGNNGLVITTENDNQFAHVVANEDTVSKCGLDTNYNSIIPRTYFGCTSATTANIPNVLGITNGADGGVWVNGHVPIHFVYKYSYITYTSTCSWTSDCPNGHPDPVIAQLYRDRGNPGTPTCDRDEHYVCKKVAHTVTVNKDLNFLQDIGYVYGVNENINKGISNSESYPYLSGTYTPFTSKSNREGWFGITPTAGGDTWGRPYITGCTVTGDTAPNPGISQKGLAADYPVNASLSGNNYNLFQVNESEDRVHKLTWNGSVLNYNYNAGTEAVGIVNNDYWSISNPVHVAIDSQNNVWVIREGVSNDELSIIYQLQNNTIFPNGGNCRWPTVTSIGNPFGIADHYVYGAPYNDPYVEYYLTRDTTFISALTTNATDGYRSGFGICLTGDYGQQRESARQWCTTNIVSGIAGLRIYTNYGGASSTHSFARYGGDTIEYNSDNFGTCFAFTQQYLETYPAIIHPSETRPTIDLKISKVDSTPTNCDNDFWNDQNLDNTPLHTSASGYDDFQVELSATAFLGSYELQSYEFHYNDKIQDIGGSVNPVYLNTLNNVINYVYHDPSLNGKPNHHSRTWPAETDGIYEPYVQLVTNTNVYYVTGDEFNGHTDSNIVTAIVWERWPTAKFYITPIDTASIRQTHLTSWNLTSFNYPVGDNGLSINSENRIVSGYDPLSAQFTDQSITRTWPITGWFWTFGDRLDFGGFALANSVLGVTYAHVTSVNISSSTPVSQRDDCTTEHLNMVEHIYKAPGTYNATLWVAVSNTGTDSWNISTGVNDPSIMGNSFTVAASRQVKVLEVCPNMTYWFVSTQTLSSNYSDDSTSFVITSADIGYQGMWTSYGLISGYAPNLTVSFAGSVTARSLPFSAFKWDFSDPYADPNPLDYTYYSYPKIGWPQWRNVPYLTSAIHTFVMPGYYNVTLIPIVSSPQLSYSSNCSGLEKKLHVYVEEIKPQTCFTLSGNISGTSPITITVNPSCTIAGSFPICRIDWNFGDNTPLITISRLMSAEYTNYFNSSTYTDLSDPRNIIVTHEYARTMLNQSDTYTANLSVYACNTNTLGTSSTGLQVGPIELAQLHDVEGDIHLIENRMMHQDNDLLLVFEGQKNLNSYTVLLSTDRL